MSNLLQRVLVAVTAIPLVIYICFKPFSLLGLAIIFTGLAVHEFYAMAKTKGFLPQTVIGTALALLITASFAHFRIPLHLETTDLMPLILIFGVIATLTAELFSGRPNPLVQTSVTLAGALYVGIGVGGLYGVHDYFYAHAAVTHAPEAIASVGQIAGYFTITMLASIWICDSAAYFVGRAIGRHKIAPSVSPNKSWEGGVAGVVGAIAAWFAAKAFLPDLAGVSTVTLIAMGVISGVFGQVGDFAESMLKRDAGVKDSSTLIPGHGGVLDRLDSILFVAPLVYLYLHLFGI